MSSSARIQSSLSRHVPKEPMQQDELDRMRAKAWTERGLICIAPEEIEDDWLKAGLVQVATKKFGKRMQQGN
jgi:hypothetical protein